MVVIFVVGVFLGIMMMVGIFSNCVVSVVFCVWLLEEKVMMLCLCCLLLNCESVFMVLWNLKVFMCWKFLYLKNSCVFIFVLVVCECRMGVLCVYGLMCLVVSRILVKLGDLVVLEMGIMRFFLSGMERDSDDV